MASEGSALCLCKHAFAPDDSPASVWLGRSQECQPVCPVVRWDEIGWDWTCDSGLFLSDAFTQDCMEEKSFFCRVR